MPDVLDQPKPVPTAEYYQLIHEQIGNENSSMNQRVNWLIISQSFFFSGFATLLSTPPDPENGIYALIHDLLVWAIPGISLVTSILIYVGILVSLKYMAYLRDLYQSYPHDHTTDHFPPIQGTPAMRRLAQLPAIAVPLLFISTWLVLLILELH